MRERVDSPLILHTQSALSFLDCTCLCHALNNFAAVVVCIVAPVTKRSRKSKTVLMRQTAHVRLRNAVYHWARTAVQHYQRSLVKYAALLALAHLHCLALLSIAYLLLAVSCAML